MKAKKIGKIILRIVLILLLLTVGCLLTTSVIYHVQYRRAVDVLEENGSYSLVSAGDYQVGLCAPRNPDGKHRIIALAGYGDGEMCIGWRNMTDLLEPDNAVYFLDRAGYGHSDDCKDDMTVSYIVEHYRTALKNAGVPAPYVLMPHSIGGLYATYWVSKYPDEIEGVVILDGTIPQPVPESERSLDLGILKLMKPAEALGLLPFYVRANFAGVLPFVSKENQAVIIPLMAHTAGSDAAYSEMSLAMQNVNDTWEAIVPNDVPKLYLDVSGALYTKDDLLAVGMTADVLRNMGIENAESMNDEELYQAALDMIAEIRRESRDPYAEKMGNCQVTELLGQHEIFIEKPEECGRIVREFIDGLDASNE